MMAHESLEAAHELAAEGIEATVLDVRTLAPLDRPAILAVARATGKILIVHEDNLTGGIGAEIAALIAEHAFDDLDAPVRRLAAPDIPAMPFSKPVEDHWLPSARGHRAGDARARGVLAAGRSRATSAEGGARCRASRCRTSARA